MYTFGMFSNHYKNAGFEHAEQKHMEHNGFEGFWHCKNNSKTKGKLLSGQPGVQKMHETQWFSSDSEKKCSKMYIIRFLSRILEL